jgi:hypothetical protein
MKTIFYPLFLLPLMMVLPSCKGYVMVPHEYSYYTPPAAPDYSQGCAWAALPDRLDNADLLPDSATMQNHEATADVDVFFVYPTSFFGKTGWNCDLNNEKVNQKTDDRSIKYQASVFNGSAKIYAPRYRQANYASFFNFDGDGAKALDLAYQDVKQAFQYYLDHYNHGRAFILAGHSQGSYHLIRLCKEMIEGQALQQKLVAAYLIGMPVKQNFFKDLPVCDAPEENHCYLTWNTFKVGFYPKYYDSFFKGAVCVNPLTWSTDTAYEKPSCHVGMMGPKFSKMNTELFGARVSQGGLLWVDPVIIPGMKISKTIKVWHQGDINLFYGNIRDNLELRVANYQGKYHPSYTASPKN